jgi:hypothetical protein
MNNAMYICSPLLHVLYQADTLMILGGCVHCTADHLLGVSIEQNLLISLK